MIKLEMRTSPRMVQQIAAIERFSGLWDRLSQSEAVASDSLLQAALHSGAESCFRLDASSPAGLSMFIEVERLADSARLNSDLRTAASPLSPQISKLRGLIDAHLVPAEFDIQSINRFYQLLAGPGSRSTSSEALTIEQRKNSQHFMAPGLGFQRDEVVFPTVSVFLIEQRLAELVEWTQHELEAGNFHPLFIIGTFHLLFLQIHPFPAANHTLALLLLWRLLDEHGYSFVRYSHFAAQMEKRPRQYFAALRQAEKTACSNWSTLNIWLELFLDTLIYSSNELLDSSTRNVTSARLTPVQRKIIDAINSSGAATREKIVIETGINISTVKYNLSVLATRGHLERQGNGRSTSYRVL